MSTFLNDAKIFYHDFFDKGAWSEEYANEILNEKEDINKRKESIKETYELVLENSAIHDAVKDWVKTNHSIQETASIKGIATSIVKNHIYYINKTIGKKLAYKGNSIIRFCLLTERISEYDWKEINRIIQALKVKENKKVKDKEDILNNRNLLINIPSKEYETSITDEKFNDFLRLITPYFISERKRVQQRINEQFLDAAGYINYLMSPGVSLSDLDKQRLKKIKQLLDSETLEKYEEQYKDKMLDITKVKEQKKENDSKDEYHKQVQKEIEEGKHLEVKTKRIQYNF